MLTIRDPNYRDPVKGHSKTKSLYNLGRKEEVDQEAIKKFINSLYRFTSPEQAAEAQAWASRPEPSKFVSSRSTGGSSLVLKGIWKRLHIDKLLDKALKNRAFTAPIAETIFAIEANKAITSGPKPKSQWLNSHFIVVTWSRSKKLREK